MLPKTKFLSRYIYSIKKLLENVNLPINLTVKKFIFIKYILSVLIFLISLLNYRTLTVPSILFITIFFIPNIIIKNHVKSQNIKLIKELKVLNSNLMLQLSAYVPFKDALKNSVEQIGDVYIKKNFNKFVYDYEVMGFNIRKPAEKLVSKFKSDELVSFMQMLLQCEDEGNIIENLERFDATLKMSYFKYLNSQAIKRTIYMILGTVIMLINITILCVYPMLVQMYSNLNMIFS